MAQPIVPLTQLHGTWRLMGRRVTGADGKVFFSTGDNPRGFLIYAPDGYMSVAFFMPMPDKAGKIAERFIAYSGRWELDGDHMRHFCDVHSNPENLGVTAHRKVSFEDGKLLLGNAPDPIGGPGSKSDMIWQRI